MHKQKNKILVTGANGLLGRELAVNRLFDFIGIGRKECDITKISQVHNVFKNYNPDIVLHLAAYTDVENAELKKKECYTTNVVGTANIAKFAKFLIYMSTEYVFDGERGNYKEGDIPNPVNFYALTKLLGEFEAKMAKRHLIIRTLFKPRAFKHKNVCGDMWTSGDYVDVIAREIAHAVKIAERLPEIIHIGTGRKNLYNLAKQTREDAIPIKRADLKIRLPRDTSLNTKLWERLKNGNQS